MPLTLVPPRKGQSPNWRVRGKYLGIAVDRSTGASEQKIAREIFKRWKQEIERGEYQQQAAEPVATPHTFLAAAVAYMKADGDARFLGPIIKMTGEHALRDRAITEIDQIALDNCADALYPRAPSPTRNRQFYTPVSAVLKHAGVDKRFKRPKGWRGSKSTSWLDPEHAFALFAAADAIDREFGLLLRTLLYTGMRLGEALAITLANLNLQRATLYLPKTKNGGARSVHLPPVLVAALAAQPPRPVRGANLEAHGRGQVGRSQADAGVAFLDRPANARLFRFHAGTPLRKLLARAKKAAGLSFPRRQGGFHLFCHTYGTWMHRYGNLDNFGLTRTERWLDPRSADRYMHTDVNAEARQADLLPVEPIRTEPLTLVRKGER